MKQNRKQLKSAAREAMKQAKPSFALVTLVFILLVNIIPLVISTLLGTNISMLDTAVLAATSPTDATTYLLSTGMLGLFLSLVIALFTTIIGFGQTLWSLRCWRREECTLGTLVEGFATAPHVIFVMILSFLMQFAQLFFWLIIFSILMPFFLASFYGFILIGFIGVFSITMFIVLRFSFVHHVMADNPTMGAMETISTAIALTHKRLWELFCLHLSFFGWNLLAVLIQYAGIAAIIFFDMNNYSGISTLTELQIVLQDILLTPATQWVTVIIAIPLSLWIIPYTSTTISGFYNNLINSSTDTTISGFYNNPINSSTDSSTETLIEPKEDSE